jgi:multicomponent Na+:H+ antiporter subunit D
MVHSHGRIGDRELARSHRHRDQHSTLLNAGYFLPIVFRAFFREPPKNSHGHVTGEAPWPIVAALTATAIGTLLMFLSPDIPLALAKLMGAT